MERTFTPPTIPRVVDPARAPYLFSVLSCADPFRPPARFFLGGVRATFLRRDAQAGTQRFMEYDSPALAVTLPEPCMSAHHAKIIDFAAGYSLHDTGSKNGTFHNGRRVDGSTILQDGDLIELGGAVLVFRTIPTGHPPAGDLEAPPVTTGEARPMTLLPAFAAELERLRAVAAGSNVPILVRGESGTGKEGMARAIHAWSGRTGPLVPVNCGGIAPSVLESELFGSVRGAFTGAIDRPGLIRQAHQGTLLLDELGDLPASAQAALLRVLQDGQVLPVGGSRAVPVDVRLVSATNKDLDAMVHQGLFRADLLARVRGITITLPPLRERIVDLGLLVAALLLRHRRQGQAQHGLTWDAARALVRYPWPLNIRELERCLMVALPLAEGRAIDVMDLSPDVRPYANPDATPQASPSLLAEHSSRRAEIEAQLATHGGNIAAAARSMNVTRQHMNRLLKQYGIDPKRFRDRTGATQGRRR